MAEGLMRHGRKQSINPACFVPLCAPVRIEWGLAFVGVPARNLCLFLHLRACVAIHAAGLQP